MNEEEIANEKQLTSMGSLFLTWNGMEMEGLYNTENGDRSLNMHKQNQAFYIV